MPGARTEEAVQALVEEREPQANDVDDCDIIVTCREYVTGYQRAWSCSGTA